MCYVGSCLQEETRHASLACRTSSFSHKLKICGSPIIQSLYAAHMLAFLSKSKLFSKNSCICAFFVVPLYPISAALAELVDALDLGSSFERSEGSSPLCRTSGQSDPIFCII